MSWPIRVVSFDSHAKEIGDAFEAPDEWVSIRPDGTGFCRGFALGGAYLAAKRADPAYRNPYFVMLPGCLFCLDSQATDEGGAGWTVTGTLPNVSVSPSINIVGIYHGFVTDGVVSDDTDGRVR